MKNTTRHKPAPIIWSLMILVAFLAGCSKPITETINGRWQKYEENGKSIEAKGSLEFFSDGSVVMSPGSDPREALQGKYTLSEEGRFKMEFQAGPKQLIMVGQASHIENGDLLMELENVGDTKWKKL